MVLMEGAISRETRTSKAVLSTKQKTFFYSSISEKSISSCQLHSVTVQPSGISNIATSPTTPNISNIEAELETSPKVAEPCTDCYPKRAQLNFYLLLLNGVRLVFTKTLAFTTILTIRATLLHL